MADIRVADLTLTEFKALIRESVAESITDLLGDPDEGPVLREGLADELRQSLAEVRAGSESLGSVEGRLEVIDIQRPSTFTICDRISGHPVSCHFEKSATSMEKVKGLLGKRVVVRGKILYFSDGIPRAIRDIEAIEDASPEPDLPAAYFGCIPDPDAARDPVAFLRLARGMD